MSKPLLNFRPKPEIAEIIRTMAAEDRRPVSQFLANLIEDALAAKGQSEQRRDAAAA
jgi:hypothetical protein